MRVIHGIWADQALCLWAEDPGLPQVRRAAPREARARPVPGPHPFACQAAELADLLAALPGAAGEAVRKAVDGELTLELPSAGGGPLASPELIRPDAPGSPGPGPRGRVSLAGWRVPVLALQPAAALDLLGAVGHLGDLAAEGGSLPYLAAVARFAEGLAARGRVLPVLVPEDGSYAARWRPVLGGTDAQRARDLAAAMPPSCRAVAAEAGAEPPGQVLAAALESLADAAARARLPGSLLPARRGRTPALVPVTERYVAALTSTDAGIDGMTLSDEASRGEVAELAAELNGWLDGARIPAGPVRTCFRLAEPGEPDSDPWRVEFSLQSAEDPSLMVPAADLWAGEGAAFAGLASRDPVEELLAGLGAAARLFAELEAALREPAPAQVELDTPGAFRFLKQTGPLLSGAGFGVLLPDWVRKARLGLKLTTRSRSTSGSSVTAPKFGLGDLVDFRYEAAVGGQPLDPADLAELARLKVPLVRLRGQWVELDEAHVQAALRFLERNRSGTMSAADALLAGLRGPEGPADEVPLVDVDADGWLGDLLSGQADRRLRPMAAPPGFTGTLRPYQERGLSWLSFLGELGLGGVLADDMGLGKTIQLLSLVASQPPGSGPTLLVCPMSLVGNWQREAARFTPGLRVHVHHGADRLDGDSLTALLARGDDSAVPGGTTPPDPPARAWQLWTW